MKTELATVTETDAETVAKPTPIAQPPDDLSWPENADLLRRHLSIHYPLPSSSSPSTINHQPSTNLSFNSQPRPLNYFRQSTIHEFKCYQVKFEPLSPMPMKTPLILSPTAACKSLLKFKLYQKNAWFGKVWLNLNSPWGRLPACRRLESPTPLLVPCCPGPRNDPVAPVAQRIGLKNCVVTILFARCS